MFVFVQSGIISTYKTLNFLQILTSNGLNSTAFQILPLMYHDKLDWNINIVQLQTVAKFNTHICTKYWLIFHLSIPLLNQIWIFFHDLSVYKCR